MQSQIRKAIGFAVVLLLLAVSLMAAMLMPVGADPESGSHTVTVKIADGQESRGTVKINVITGYFHRRKYLCKRCAYPGSCHCAAGVYAERNQDCPRLRSCSRCQKR